MHEPLEQVHFVVFEKFTSAYLFQIAREKSCNSLLIICTKNITTITGAGGFSHDAGGFSHVVHSTDMAETDYYLCQIQTFLRPTLSKSFS